MPFSILLYIILISNDSIIFTQSWIKDWILWTILKFDRGDQHSNLSICRLFFRLDGDQSDWTKNLLFQSQDKIIKFENKRRPTNNVMKTKINTRTGNCFVKVQKLDAFQIDQ